MLARASRRTYATLLSLGLALPIAGTVLLAPSTALAQGQPDEEFREGLKAFNQGRFEDAEKHFRNVLKSKPSEEQARLYRDEAGYQFWVEVLAKGGNLATLAKRLLYSAEKGALKERQDPAKIQTLVQQLWDEDFVKQTEATEALIATHGHYCVPFLVETLGDKRDDDRRVRVITLLSRLGEEGTLALIQLLKHEEPLTRLNAAVCLGNIRDKRAVPSLLRVVEKDQDPHVKREAEEALKKIGASGGGAEWYAKVADLFYRENPSVMINRYKEWTTWKLKEGKLQGKEAVRFVWGAKVARDFCYEGLSVSPNDDALWQIMLCAYASEWARIDSTLTIAEQKKAKGGEVDDAELEKVKAAKADLKKVAIVVAGGGTERVLSALHKALEDQQAEVAKKLIDMLVDLNMDPKLLPGGGSVKIEPKNAPTGEDMTATAPKAEPKPEPKSEPSTPREEPKRVTEEPKPQPKEEPKAEPKPEPKAEPKEEPKRVTEEPKAEPKPEPKEEPKAEPKPEPPKEEPKPEEKPAETPKPRRVSQAPSAHSPRTEKLGVKGPNIFAAPVGDSKASGSSGGGAGESICAALVYGDKRVRYAAAIALAKLNPPTAFANSDKVMEDLSDALGETGQRVILVVEREPDARNRIVGLLRELGYMTFGVDSGNEGLIRAKSFPGEDLIIVSSELNRSGDGGDPVEFQFIDSLRDDYRTKTIPVIVLAPRSREKTMQELVDDKRAVDVITPEVEKAILSEKIKKVFSGPDYQADEKARNDQMSKDAAMAIASIHGATVFDLGVCAKALAGCLGRADDSVKIAAMKAIASVGPKAKQDCLEPLLTVFKTKENSVDVREAAAVAIGECMKGSALDAAADTFKTLKAALNEEEERIWRAAGVALGKAQLSGEAARQLVEEQRIE